MSAATDALQAAQERALAIRPRVGGFPSLAEVLRQAGVRRYDWSLPSMQSLYLTDAGPVMDQGTPLVMGMADVAPFDQGAIIRALRANQGGESTFTEFCEAIWAAGIVRYTVDLTSRTCTYHGWNDESYVESYPAVTI